MVIRPIHREELGRFAAFSDRPARNAEFRDYLNDKLASGAVRPEWCFVADDAGVLTGRASYWTFTPGEPPESVDFLDLPWDGEYLELGVRLLRASLALIEWGERREIEYVLDDPPRFITHPRQLAEVLERFGFALARAADRWEWTPDQPLDAPSERLTYRTSDDVGEDAFLDAIQRVTEGTLDRRLLEWTGASGARAHLSFLRAMPHEPGWWRLGYDADGALVGLVAPARTQTHPVIGYIGVVPERRGRGYAADLLAAGTSALAAAGAERIRADTDVRNLPMRRAFERAGYSRFAGRREYVLDLTTMRR